MQLLSRATDLALLGCLGLVFLLILLVSPSLLRPSS